MCLHRIAAGLLIGCCVLASPLARADDAVLLRYKFTKGDSQHYRSTQELKQSQTFSPEVKIETAMSGDTIATRTVTEVSAEGKATIKNKPVRLKMTAEITGVGKFEFDSQSTERDTASMLGGALTPLYEKLSGAELEIVVNKLGNVLSTKGYAELVADIIKDNPLAAQFGAQGSDESAMLSEQEAYLILPEKPVKPGDTWEVPYEFEVPKLGKFRGKNSYKFEAYDMVGTRKTARINATSELTLNLDINQPEAKVTGTMSTTGSSGSVQFDPEAGRILSKKSNLSMVGQLTVDAGGMTLTIDTRQEQANSSELLDKLP
ncbi:MAG: DUF6263 family protein [Planctomycetaceae bacterium]